MTIVQFGNGSRLYDLSNLPIQTYNDNFADMVLRAKRLVNMDGGFDELGDEAGFSEIGNVNLTLFLVTYDRAAMTAKRDSLKAMASLGKRALWLQPGEPTDPLRWCSGRIISPRTPERVAGHSDLHQQVTVNWQVTYPRWQSKPAIVYQLNPGKADFTAGSDVLDTDDETILYMDGDDLVPGLTLDDGAYLNRPRLFGRVKNGSTFTLTNNGSASAPMKVTFYASVDWFPNGEYVLGDPGLLVGGVGCSSMTNFGLRQLNDWGHAHNEWRWMNTLSLRESLTVDGLISKAKYRAEWSNQNGFRDWTRFYGKGWTRCLPGETNFEVYIEDMVGDFCWLEIDYWDTYF